MEIRTTAEDKKTMTLNLSNREMNALEKMCERKGLSKTQVVKQALRVYQSIEERIELGDKLYCENPATKNKAELMLL